MNEQAVLFLKELSNKLGTTSEYLFSALVKQAPISGIINLLVIVLLFVLTFLWTRNVYKKSCLHYYEEESIRFFAWLSVIILLFISLCMLESLPIVISGLINPEYWALKEISNMINKT